MLVKYLVLLLAWFKAAECARILGICAIPVHSHSILMERILNKLAETGHEVTIITPLQLNNPNFTEIYVNGLLEHMKGDKRNFLNLGQQSVASQILEAYYLSYKFSTYVFNAPEVKAFLEKSNHFDAIILDQFLHDAFLGFAFHYKAQVIYSCSFGTNVWSNHYVGNPSPLSYIPNKFSNHHGEMTFTQRFANAFNYFFEELYRSFVAFPKFNQLMKTLFPEAPELSSLMYQNPLMLLNTHYTISEAVPLMPNMVEIAGAHLKETALPLELKTYLDESANGVILFALGSNLRMDSLPRNKIEIFLKVFSGLPQNVLWKWEGGAVPKSIRNVKITKWLPQFDVLGHRNVKAFITHGGLLSCMEAVHRGVPILGMPFFGDQNVNVRFLQSKGFGVHLDYATLDEASLQLGLAKVLNDSNFKDNAEKRSAMFRDRDMDPLDKAVFWVEHSLRFGGLKELRSAGMDLEWYQREMMDVALVLVGSVLIVAVLALKVIRRTKVKVD